MRSFFSRCSLIIPLVCALMVASESGQFSITSVNTDNAIVSGASGDPVETHTDNPVTLTVDPVPESVTISTIYDQETGLYVGAAVDGTDLIWVVDPYSWHVAKTGGGPYVIFPVGRDVYWCQNSTISPYIQLIPGPDIQGDEGFWNFNAVA